MTEHVGDLVREPLIQLGARVALRARLSFAHEVDLGQFAHFFVKLQDLPITRTLDSERRRVVPGHALHRRSKLREIHNGSVPDRRR